MIFSRSNNQKPVFILGIFCICVAFLSSCTGRDPAVWKTPADEAQLAKLEAATLSKGFSRSRRAKLFFLWGQELAASSNQSGSPDSRDQAIAAFERVVDLDSVLVGESRHNLEILWRQKAQQEKQDQQNQQDQPDQKDKQDQQGNQDQQNGKQNKQDGQQDQKDQQNQQSGKSDDKKADNQADSDKSQQQQQQQQAAQQKEDANAPKDISGLVRDKEQKSELEKALRQESERRAEQQQMQAGSALPVEKDW